MDCRNYLECRFDNPGHQVAFKTEKRVDIMAEKKIKPKKMVFLEAILIVGALISIFMLWQKRPVTPQLLIPTELRGLLLPEPKQLTPFKLVDQFGAPFGLDRLQGNWSFIFYGYTHCPDVCPTSLGFLAEVFDQLKAYPGALDNTQAFFISVDPKRDTPELLKDYVPYFNEKFIGVTGSAAEIDSITKQMWAQYQLSDEVDEDGNYSVDHTAAFFVVDPKGRLFAIFSSELQRTPETVSKAFSLIRPMVK